MLLRTVGGEASPLSVYCANNPGYSYGLVFIPVFTTHTTGNFSPLAIPAERRRLSICNGLTMHFMDRLLRVTDSPQCSLQKNVGFK